MKKRLIIFSAIAVTLVTAVVVLSGHVKDILIRTVDKALIENVNAQVVWDHDQFSVSIFRDFPSVTATLSDIGVINNAPFENDVLFVTDRLSVSVDLWSLFGNIKINGISLENPIINIKVNESGAANYDIAISADSTSSSDEPSTYDIGIDHWEIINGTIIYQDMQNSTMMELHHVNHSGSGNFTPGEVSVDLTLSSDSVFISQGNTTFLSNKTLDLALEVDIEDDYSRFILGNNTIKINEFTVSATGEATMLEDAAYQLNLSLSAPDNEFGNLLSLVPGIYTEDFGDIRTTGSFSFATDIEGIYDEDRLPAFRFALETHDASFHYEGMPVGVENIVLDIKAENTSGVPEETRISLNQLGMTLGTHNVSARMIIENLRDYAVDGNITAHVDLGELTSVFPMEGLALSGISNFDVNLKGSYDSTNSIMPVLEGSLDLQNVSMEDKDLGYALSQVNMASSFTNPTGRFTDFSLVIPSLSFIFEEQKVNVDGSLKNLDNISWVLNADGRMDLYKMLTLFQMTDYGIEAGELSFDINTRGDLAALEAERYADLPTSGNLQLNGLRYADPMLASPLQIEKSNLTFTPSHITLEQFDATLGESDFHIDGKVMNYLNYVFSDAELLRAEVNLNSTRINLDEFMNADYSGDTITTEDSSDDLLRIPSNVDIVMNTGVAEMLVSGIKLTNLQGKARIADERVVLSNLEFGTLGGNVSGSGVFQTRELPASIDMNMKASGMDIAKTAGSVEFVRTYMPVAGVLNGTYGTDLTISGDVNDDLSMDLKTINSDAIVKSSAVTFEPSKLTNQITSLSGLNESELRQLNDILMHVTIREGNLYVEPFDVKIGKYKAEVAGTNGLDGSMAYEMTVFLPAGDLGEKLNRFVNENGGSVNQDEIPVTFGIGGSWDSPEVMLLKNEQQEAVKQTLKQKAAGEAEKAARDLVDKVEDEDTKALITSILGGKKPADSVKTKPSDSTKTNAADSTKTDAADLKEQALDEVKNFLKKKKKKANE